MGPVLREEGGVRGAHPQFWAPGAAVALAEGGMVPQPAEAGRHFFVGQAGVAAREDEAVAGCVGNITQIEQAARGELGT